MPSEVGEAAVHEHRGQERQIDGPRRRLKARGGELLSGPPVHDHGIVGDDVLPGPDLRGYCGEGVREPVVLPSALKHHEDEHVQCDEHVVDDGRPPDIGIVVANGKHDWVALK